MKKYTAYFGFLDICKPKTVNTLLVSRVSDKFGFLVGQIYGLKAIGIAGSDNKWT